MAKKKNKQLIKLQKEWYDILKKTGFNDLEYFDNSMEPKDMMYRETTKHAMAMTNDKFESTEQYYIEASKFYWDNEFHKPIHKEIWFLHSEGHAYRKIAKDLNVPYQLVFKTINKYKDIMLKKQCYPSKTDNQNSI